MVAIDTVPLASHVLPAGIDIGQSLFELVPKLGLDRPAWELAWPSAANLDAKVAGWLERPMGEAVLTMELTGVSRRGARVYRAFEYHYPAAFRYGLIRLVPKPVAIEPAVRTRPTKPVAVKGRRVRGNL
jgi:hypothetical protein